jgi:hypothetical protein
MAQDDITARRITLVDAAGQPRIIMDAGGEDGYAQFTILSTSGERLEISAQPNGTVGLSFDQPSRLGQLMLTKHGFDLRAANGKFAITIGDFFDEGVERIIVYRKGQPIWSMPVTDVTPNA